MKKIVEGIRIILYKLNIGKNNFYDGLNDMKKTLDEEFNMESMQNIV